MIEKPELCINKNKFNLKGFIERLVYLSLLFIDAVCDIKIYFLKCYMYIFINIIKSRYNH